MSQRHHRSRRVVGLACAFLLVTACGPGDDGNGAVEEVEGLEGASVTVGSKQFDEQVILGQMAVLALEAVGADVTDRTALAGTAVVREALETGEIDLYWEYTGTAWADIFGQQEVLDDPEELLEAVREMDQENGITWGERAEFENTYALAQNQQTAERLGVTTLSELAELSRSDPDEATLCIAEEFATRDDGFPGMAEHYEMEIPPGNIEVVDEGIIYTEVANESEGTCNFGMVFTTDGRIGSLDLEVLEDDEAFFPEYNPAIAIRTEVAEEYPDIVDLMNDIIGTLDTESMQELNLRAAEGGELPEDIARDWLEEQGIL